MEEINYIYKEKFNEENKICFLMAELSELNAIRWRARATIEKQNYNGEKPEFIWNEVVYSTFEDVCITIDSKYSEIQTLIDASNNKIKELYNYLKLKIMKNNQKISGSKILSF